MKNKYTPVIGLEVHVELKTNSKMFCGCSSDYFGQKPNTHTCPVCLGLPGALPVPNGKAVEWCVMIAMALNCEIALTSKFDRKNYFYPDLAKGYQISQYDMPFGENGHVILGNLAKGEMTPESRMDPGQARMTGDKTIRIRRVHMEEDTGKLIHETVNGEKVSLIDFNRSGVPLVEIVTQPDFKTAEEVTKYLQKLQQIVRYLGVSNANMEKGEMRLEPNISLRPSSSPTTIGDPSSIDSRFRGNDRKFELPPYKVEVKNINSFSFVEKAIAFEIQRQAEILDKGDIPAQETRGFVEKGDKTVSQRSKEDAMDYRYFPEPDIPPIEWTESEISHLRAQMPELPDEKKMRFIKEFQLSEYNADILTRDIALADYFEECIKICHPELVSGSHQEKKMLNPFGLAQGGRVQHDIGPTEIANWIINKKPNIDEVLPAQLIQQIVQAKKVTGISAKELEEVLTHILQTNEKAVIEYKSGKENVIMFLVGQAMRELKGKVSANDIKIILKKMLQ